jgi:hypothetical protein
LKQPRSHAHRAADVGDPEGLYYLGAILQEAGDSESAMAPIYEAADLRHEKALLLLADIFHDHKDTTNEMKALRDAAEHGSLTGLPRFLKMLKEHGEEEQIHQIGWQVTTACGLSGRLLYAGMQREAGDDSAYENLVNRTPDVPDAVTLSRVELPSPAGEADHTGGEQLDLVSDRAGQDGGDEQLGAVDVRNQADHGERLGDFCGHAIWSDGCGMTARMPRRRRCARMAREE